MRVAEQRPFLEAVDSAFLPLGFTRPKRSQEWSKGVGDDRLWFYLNFGLALINPTVGVEYLDLRRRWRDLPSAVYGTFVVLGSKFKPTRTHSASDLPSRIVADLRDAGLAIIDGLRNREAVVESLGQSGADSWPTASFSDRIRLLPILLSSLGRPDEAIAFARSVATEAATRDQVRPPYAEFLSALADAKAG